MLWNVNIQLRKLATSTRTCAQRPKYIQISNTCEYRISPYIWMMQLYGKILFTAGTVVARVPARVAFNPAVHPHVTVVESVAIIGSR